jgi:hypothetical protein
MGLSNRVPMRLARPHAMKDIAGTVGVGGRVGVTGHEPELRRRALRSMHRNMPEFNLYVNLFVLVMFLSL